MSRIFYALGWIVGVIRANYYYGMHRGLHDQNAIFTERERAQGVAAQAHPAHPATDPGGGVFILRHVDKRDIN